MMLRGHFVHTMAKNLSRIIRQFQNCIYLSCNIPSRHIFTVSSRYGSTLVLSGRRAREQFAYINPYINYDEQLTDPDQFQEEIKLRGLNINVHEMTKMWDTYKEIYKLTQETMNKKHEVLAKLKEVKKLSPEKNSEALTSVLKDLQIANSEFKNAQDALWDLQDTILVQLLKLPNRLDKSTPTVSKVLVTNGHLNNAQDLNAKSHLEIGKHLGLLEYRDPIQYYLCDAAVLFELGVLEYAADMLRSKDMFRMAGCDFSRSVVVEGTGLNHEDPWETFILANNDEMVRNDSNKLHLVGGASMMSMLTMFVKTSLYKSTFPIRCFSTGKQYTPYPDSSVQHGLFMACQASIAQVFAAVDDPNSVEYKNIFDELVHITSQLYSDICEHYRVVLRAASELKNYEAKRVSFELWSPYARKYVEVGHIAAYSDYISKRLLMYCKMKDKSSFSGVISGTVLSVPKLLACLWEQNPNRFDIPEKIRTTSIFNAYNQESIGSVK